MFLNIHYFEIIELLMKFKPAEDKTNCNKYMNNHVTDQEIIKKYLKNNFLSWKFVCQDRSNIYVIEEVY